MQNKKWIVIFVLVVLAAAAFLAGFSGVIDLTKRSEESTATASDRLIGALITENYLDLFDAESYIQDHLSQMKNGKTVGSEEADAYSGRLYATSVSSKDGSGTPNVFFEDIDGIRIFCAYITNDDSGYWASSGDDGCSDSKMHITETDTLNRIELEGTVYTSTLSGWKRFYVNPMYQTIDGHIYVVSGAGISLEGETASGMSASQTMNESKTTTVNAVSKTQEANITIHFTLVDPPDSVTVLQFDRENQVIAQDTYTADQLPETVAPLDAVQYLILETTGIASDGTETVTRTLVSREDEYASAFSVRKDGICVKHSIAIQWKNV